MRDDVRLLLGLVDPSSPLTPERAGALTAETTPAVIASLLKLAASHRVEGFLGARLNALPADTVPADLRDPLVRALHRNKVRAMSALRERDRILHAFAQHDVSCIVLKGADLAFRIYADPGARPFEDLDLLVHECDVSKADHALRDLDYAMPPDLLPSPVIRKLHFHLPYLHREGRAFVEVHWQLVDSHSMNSKALDGVWAGSEHCPEGRRVLAPPTYAAYLAVHLAKHGILHPQIATHPRAVEILLHPWADARLIWFIDLWQLAERFALSPDDILNAGERLGCRGEVDRALRFVQQLFPGCPWKLSPAPPAEKQGRVAQTVTERLLQRILGDLDHDQLATGSPPWLLTTNKRLHIRPIRMFSRRNAHV